MKKYIYFAVLCALMLAPMAASAQQFPTWVKNLLDTAASWFLTIIIGLSVIFILIGAFFFVAAGGDTDKVEKGKQYILWAAVGLAVALLAKAIVQVVETFTGQIP